MLEVRLLGKFEVRVDGSPVKLTSRPAQALLAYLILNPGIEHPREKLAGVLWPESSEAAARGNLRQALWQLNRQLGGRHVRADKSSISLGERTTYSSDISRLLRASPGMSTSDLQEAVSVYAGQLLPGFYENWVTLERERIDAAFEQKIASLLSSLLEESGWREAVDWAEKWIALGTGPEAAYRALMVAHANLGEAARVRESYERCTRNLKEDLGVEISPETRDLYQRLLQPEARAGGEPPTLRPPDNEAVDFPAEMVAPAELSPFVGREAPLSLLEQHLDEAISGKGRVLFVLGDAGQGKTALMREFCRRALARRQGLRVGFGTCDAYTGQGDAYLPFRQISGNLTGDVEPLISLGLMTRDQARQQFAFAPTALEVVDRHAPEVVSLILLEERLISLAPLEMQRSLRERLAQRPGPTLDQAIVFEQFARFLKGTSERAPLLLLVDDLQWGDEASLGLLMHLGRSLASRRILLIGAYRPADVAEGRAGRRHPVEAVVNELRRRHGDILIDLQTVEELEGQQFIDSFLDTEPNALPQSFRDALFRHTGGHPLFTIELLRAMQERGELARGHAGLWVEGQPIEWDRLPARVEAAIQERVDRLPEDLRRILDTASVQGEMFFVAVVARILNLKDREVTHSLGRRLSAELRLVRDDGLIQTSDVTFRRFRFSHHLIQRYLYHALSQAERRDLHGEIGNALEELYAAYPDLACVALAYHFGQAGIIEKAAANHARAGDLARARFAYREAIDHYGRAVAVLAQNDPRRFEILLSRVSLFEIVADRARQRADVEELRRLAGALGGEARHCDALLAEARYLQASDPASVRSRTDQAAHLARSLADPVREGRAFRILGETAIGMYDNEVAEASLVQGIDLMRSAGREDLAPSMLHSLVVVEDRRGNYDRALGLAEEALSLARSIGDRREEAIALRRKGVPLNNLGRFEESVLTTRDALRIHLELGDLEEAGHALNNEGIVLGLHGRFEESGRVLRESVEVAFESNSSLLVAMAVGNLAPYCFGPLGKYEEAADFVEMVQTRLGPHPPPWLESRLRWERAQPLHMLGQFRELSNELAELGRTFQELDDPVVSTVIGFSGRAEFELGHIEEARHLVGQAIAGRRKDITFDSLVPLVSWIHIHLGAEQGRRDPAVVEAGTQALAYGRRASGRPTLLIEALREWAELQLALAEPESAYAASKESIILYEQVPNCHFPTEVLFTHCRTSRATGRQDEADQYLTKAYRRLDLVARNTRSPKLRRSWLENVKVNREILSEVVARGIGPDLRETMLDPGSDNR